MKKIFNLFALFSFALIVSIGTVNATPRSRVNLNQSQNNLDTLVDKGNNLSQLIGELQGLKVQGSTSAASTVDGSGTILVPGISTEDTIIGAIVFSSAGIQYASSETLTTSTLSPDENIGLRSKIPGIMGNNISIAITAQSTFTVDNTSVQIVALVVVTTGYHIQVKLSSSAENYDNDRSSVNAIVAAIKAHAAANSIVNPFAVGTGTGVPSTLAETNLNSGQGTVQGLSWLSINGAEITAAGQVQVTTSGAVAKDDWLLWLYFDRDLR